MHLPIAKGCIVERSKKASLECFNYSISYQISEHIDCKVLQSLNLAKQKLRVTVFFTIDKTGSVKDIDIKTNDIKLTAAIENALKKISILKPLFKDGHPVNLRFGVPVIFRL